MDRWSILFRQKAWHCDKWSLRGWAPRPPACRAGPPLLWADPRPACLGAGLGPGWKEEEGRPPLPGRHRPSGASFTAAQGPGVRRRRGGTSCPAWALCPGAPGRASRRKRPGSAGRGRRRGVACAPVAMRLRPLRRPLLPAALCPRAECGLHARGWPCF